MTAGTALVVHPQPDDRLLSALLDACEHVVVLSEASAAPRPFAPRPNVTRHSCAGGADLVGLAREIDRRRPVDVVPPVWEGGVEATAAICEALGLPGNSVAAARASRDKHQAAACFARHHIPHPRTMLFSASDEIQVEIEQSFDFPFILKSPRSTNSQSVVLVRSSDELSSRLATLRRLYTSSAENRLFGLYAARAEEMPILVQEYIDGIELNIDILFNERRHLLLGAFEKHPMRGPTFEEIQSVYPPRASAAALEECVAAAAGAARALGATLGAAHVELRLAGSRPIVIEAALRPGGFLTPTAIQHLTGVHPITALAGLLMTGAFPEVAAPLDDVACLYGAVNCAVEGRIQSITEEHVVREAVDGLVAFAVLKRPGDRVVPLPLGSDYHVASFMLTGRRRERLEASARRIRRRLKVVVS
jgi:biotin carboxylase